MVLGLIVKFLIYFEFIFVYGMRSSTVDPFACSCPVFPAPFIEETTNNFILEDSTSIYVVYE